MYKEDDKRNSPETLETVLFSFESLELGFCSTSRALEFELLQSWALRMGQPSWGGEEHSTAFKSSAEVSELDLLELLSPETALDSVNDSVPAPLEPKDPPILRAFSLLLPEASISVKAE